MHSRRPSGLANIPEVETLPPISDQDEEKWLQFVEGESILKKGFVNKRKGLFARKRMFLLTTGPRLFYIDPVSMVKKGEIPWSADLRVEAKNFKIFFVHTVSIDFIPLICFYRLYGIECPRELNIIPSSVFTY